MNAEVSFRDAAESDLGQLMRWMREFYAIDNYAFDETIARAGVVQLMHDHTFGRVWMIDLDGSPVGYLVLTFSFSLEFHGRNAFVDELFILERHRDQGVGTRTMEFILKFCRSLGVKAIHLEVERRNAIGRSLYNKFGFINHDRLLLTKWLLDSNETQNKTQPSMTGKET